MLFSATRGPADTGALGVYEGSSIMEYDLFISHASEDKESLVAPLATLLSDLGVKVWYDEFSLTVGESLSRSIDKGLATSRFGLVVLSQSFISKPWPEYELRGLVSKEMGRDKVILPLWHHISRDEVLSFSPPLADMIALDTAKLSLHEIALRILKIVRPDIFENLLRRELWRKKLSEVKPEVKRREEIKLGPIRHKTLPENLLVRIKIIHHIFSDVFNKPLEQTINLFRRDLNVTDEVALWEKLAAAYLERTSGKGFIQEKQREIARVLVGLSVGAVNDENACEFEHLSYKGILEIAEAYRDIVPKITKAEDEQD